MFSELSVTQQIAIWALPVLLAITLHEAAHAWVAMKLGDSTAYLQGRVTLNPFKHIDPIGTVVVPGILLLLSTGFIFGWAKPVPVQWQHLRSPRRDIALVSAAGPGANLLMAIGWAIVGKIAFLMSQYTELQSITGESLGFLFFVSQAGLIINLLLMILNLLPILPLDGGRVLCSLLPPRLAFYYAKTEPFGFFILLGLLLLGVLNLILYPLLTLFYRIFRAIFGL
ncbi:site-2 protease family protein [Thioflexithrix psekupsensis]|uniref:Site-2 protease family protein n=1 Tax=Thioflexithrix psekupsensis TaxID=1570016 RepID=A0A251XB25_9GAMM|nr:site-2 protease family protein [Thioflexithrix psekupsensis]OUD15300.1 site-2 protease family protein [Thioflexithrix psekupsensis]